MALLRTADAVTPFLTARAALASLIVFVAVYSLIFAFGSYYIYRLLRAGPAGQSILPPVNATPKRPLSVAGDDAAPSLIRLASEADMILFWVFVLVIATLLYVLLDGFDLGVGIIFGLTRNEAARQMMLSAVSPVWDGNETWLVVTAVVLWGAFPLVYATLLSAFYLPAPRHARRPDPARRRLRVSL